MLEQIEIYDFSIMSFSEDMVYIQSHDREAI